MSNFPLLLAITAEVHCSCLRYAYCTTPIQRKLKLQPSNAQIKDEPRNWFKDLRKNYSWLWSILGGWQLRYWVHTRLKQDANANANAIHNGNTAFMAGIWPYILDFNLAVFELTRRSFSTDLLLLSERSCTGFSAIIADAVAAWAHPMTASQATRRNAPTANTTTADTVDFEPGRSHIKIAAQTATPSRLKFRKSGIKITSLTAFNFWSLSFSKRVSPILKHVFVKLGLVPPPFAIAERERPTLQSSHLKHTSPLQQICSHLHAHKSQLTFDHMRCASVTSLMCRMKGT